MAYYSYGKKHDTRRKACTVTVATVTNGKPAEWTETFCAEDIREGLATARIRALREQYGTDAVTQDDYRVDREGNRLA